MDGLIEQRQFLFFQMLTGPYAMNAAQQRRFADWLFDSGHVWRCLGFQAGLCSLAGNDCFWLELGADGMAYSCNKGYAADRAFADWRESSLAEVIAARHSLYASHAVGPACTGCRAWNLCHGGCPLERSGDQANDCALRLRLFDRLQADGQDLGAFIAANRHLAAAYYARARSLDAVSRRFDANRKP